MTEQEKQSAETQNTDETTEPQGNAAEPQGEGVESQNEASNTEATDWKAESRKWEARAKENFAKAKRLDEIEEANKSELERARDAQAKAEKEAEEAKRSQLLYQIASETGVPANLIKGTNEDELRQSAQDIQEFAKSQKPNIPVDQGGAASGSKTVTKESIDGIKNPLEFVKTAASNANLYSDLYRK